MIESRTGIFMVWQKAAARIKRKWLLLLLALLPLLSSAQNIPTRNFTMQDGLPGMAIRAIFKDSQGLMWIATDSGICTYDGTSFRIFKRSEGMTTDMIWAIEEDEYGNMWFGSFGQGLIKYDGKKFKKFTRKDGLISDRIRALCYSKNFHCLVAASEGGVSVLRGDSITTSGGETFCKKNGSIATAVADAGKYIYITTFGPNNPVRYYPDQNKFITLMDKGISNESASFSVLFTSKGDTAFSYKTGVRIKGTNGEVACDSMGQVFGISEDKRGDLWFASWSYLNREFQEGVFRYDGKSFKNYQSAFGITDKEIWTVYCDKEQDILWIGTLNEGLFMVPNSAITYFLPSYFGLEKNSVNNLLVDSDNTLWIAGSHELIRMKADNSFSFLPKQPMIESYINYWHERNPTNFSGMELATRLVLSLPPSNLPGFIKQTSFNFKTATEGADQTIYFTNQFGLYSYDKHINKSTYLSSNGVFGDFEIVGNDTLLTTGWGETQLMPNFKNLRSNTNFNLFHLLTKKGDSLKKGDPWNVNRLVKHGNQFWYATLLNGLWMSEGMNLINFNESDSTISNNLNDLCFDEKGRVIFGSNTGDVFIATYKKEQLTINYQINSEKGLYGNSISWLVADQHGKLWIGTNLGLNYLDLNELDSNGKCIIRFLNKEDGYTGQSSKKAVMDSSGNLWIGAGEQLLRIDTKNLISRQYHTGKVVLKSLEINNQPFDSLFKSQTDPHSMLPSGKFFLKHSQNDLVFYFDVLNYSNSENSRFRYLLEGYDSDWSDWSAARKASYTNLPSGSYNLRVESYHLSSLEHAKPLRVDFSIRQHWLGIWYIQFLILGLIAGILIWASNRYIGLERKKLHKKALVEKKIAELEMQALQAQMNPHFIFNCVSGIQYYILSRKMEEVMDYLSDFSKVVRESLANASLRVISLEQEIDFLSSYLRLEQMRFSGKFDFEIHTNTGTDPIFIHLPPMLVQPFAENAIRHGFSNLTKKGKLVIQFELLVDGILKCTITDNGIGRELAGKKNDFNVAADRPHSTQITTSRIRLFNPPGISNKYHVVYTDLFSKDKACGLKVELYLPAEQGNELN